MDNETIAANDADRQLGQNLVLNDTATREIHYILSGKNQTNSTREQQRVHMKGHRCAGSCNEAI